MFIGARKLLLYSGEDGVANFMYGCLALRCTRDGLDETLTKDGCIRAIAYCFRQGCTHKLLKHALVQSTFGFPTRVVLLHELCSTTPIHAVSVCVVHTWLCFSRQFQCCSNSAAQLSRIFVILNFEQADVALDRKCCVRGYSKENIHTGQWHISSLSFPPSSSAPGRGSQTCIA